MEDLFSLIYKLETFLGQPNLAKWCSLTEFPWTFVKKGDTPVITLESHFIFTEYESPWETIESGDGVFTFDGTQLVYEGGVYFYRAPRGEDGMPIFDGTWIVTPRLSDEEADVELWFTNRNHISPPVLTVGREYNVNLSLKSE